MEAYKPLEPTQSRSTNNNTKRGATRDHTRRSKRHRMEPKEQGSAKTQEEEQPQSLTTAGPTMSLDSRGRWEPAQSVSQDSMGGSGARS